LTSSIETTPSGPVARTRLKSTPSFFASARTAGMARTPPTLTAASLRTWSLTCMAPTTVPASARSALAGAVEPVSAAAGVALPEVERADALALAGDALASAAGADCEAGAW